MKTYQNMSGWYDEQNGETVEVKALDHIAGPLSLGDSGGGGGTSSKAG